MTHNNPLLAATILLLTAGSLGGCSLLTTTADGIAAVGEGITQSTASSSDATTSEGEETASTEQARAFAHSQHEQLRRDAAAGEGEHIFALAALLGPTLEIHDPNDFGRWIQRHYSALFFEGAQHDLVDQMLALRKQEQLTQARL